MVVEYYHTFNLSHSAVSCHLKVSIISWWVWRQSGILTPFIAQAVIWIMFWNAGYLKAWIGYHQISARSTSEDWFLLTWSVDTSHSMAASQNRSLLYGITLFFCSFSLRWKSRHDCFSLVASFWHFSASFGNIEAKPLDSAHWQYAA